MSRDDCFLASLLISSLAVASACGPTLSAGESSGPAEPPREAARVDLDAWESGGVRVVAGDLERTATRRALGAVVQRREGGARRGFDAARARAFLDALAPEVDRAPLPGLIDLERRTVRPHVDGRALLVDASVARLAEALVAGDEAIELPVATTPPATGVVPEGLELAAVLGEYSTRFDAHGRSRSRAHNVRLASSALHGAVIPAHGTLSFNGVVGPREYDRGYKKALVIQHGELVPGIGGGVCQAASTFYAAAFFAGLEFPVYTPHSRPSSYVPAGLDATVAYPDVDLVVQNPFDFPVAVAVASEEDTVTVRILGRERPRSIELARRVHRGESHTSRDVEDPALPVGQRQLTQEGAAGSIVFRTRFFVEGDRTWTEELRVEYPATDEIFHVGTGAPAVAPVGPIVAR